jgi:hypothetical protein
MRLTAHVITIPHQTPRFQNLRTPNNASTISTTCIITGSPEETSLQGGIKAIPMELCEMAFIKDASTITTKFKGSKLLHIITTFTYIHHRRQTVNSNSIKEKSHYHQ